MRMKFSTPCGQQFSAKPEAVGRTFSCPKCKEKHRIPEVLQDSAEPQRPAVLAAAAVESAVPSSAGGVCPDCSMLMPAGTVLCLACGYHTERGRRVGSEAGPTRSSEAGGVRGWLKSQLVEGEEAEGANELIDSFSLLGMLTALSVVSGVLLVSFFLQKGMEGPAFLVFYAAMLVALWIGGELFRGARSSIWLRCLAPLTFCGIGGVRVWYGLSIGMHRFQILAGMMIVGTLLMGIGLLRSEPENAGLRFGLPVVLGLAGASLIFVTPFIVLIFVLVAIKVFVLRFVRGGYGGYFGGCGGGGCGGGCGGGGCGGCGG